MTHNSHLIADGYGKADLHAHTRHDGWGDGNQSIHELFRYVEEETDLDIFAVTDHDSADTARAAWEIYQQGDYRFGFIPGIEVTNRSGHLLCYFPSGDVVDIPSLRPFWWTVQYAHEHGAICVAAHPVYPPWLGPALRRGLDQGHRIDAIEVVNAGISEKAQHRLDHMAHAFGHRVALVGNSDAHHEVAIGAAYTLFPGQTVGDFVHALRHHQTRPIFIHRPHLHRSARRFTARRSMTRPGWVRNLWRELRNEMD